jgi:hypothetical protein
MKNFIKNNGGFTAFFFLIVISFIFFAYLGFDFKKVFSVEAFKTNFYILWELFVNIWNIFFIKPITIIKDYILNVIKDFI